jgi:kynureninase
VTERLSRAAAEQLDDADPLAGLRDRFVIDDPSLVYMDGNSLGRLSIATEQRLARVIRQEWGGGLVRTWEDWLPWPGLVGDRLGEALLGAAPGQVVVSDSTTVNLYKCAAAAIDALPERRVIVTDSENFPTDRYVVEGLARERGLTLRMVRSDPVGPLTAEMVSDAIDGDVALVTFSHVSFASSAIADMPAITDLVHRAGALVLWDLSHAVGSYPVELDASNVDLAVGCTYKYVNAGPGAPAFLYVNRARQPELRQPIWGWFGQRDQFEMGPAYDPEPGIAQFLVGTSPALGLAAVDEGLKLLAEAGIDRLREKGVALTSFLIDLHDAWLAELGFRVGSPRDPATRGSHVALRHPEARKLCAALIERGVVPDFRTPDRLRFGPAPISTRFVDVWDAMDCLRSLAAQ